MILSDARPPELGREFSQLTLPVVRSSIIHSISSYSEGFPQDHQVIADCRQYKSPKQSNRGVTERQQITSSTVNERQ